MGRIANAATETVLGLLRGIDGLSAGIAEASLRENVELEAIDEAWMTAGQCPAELFDRQPRLRFPCLRVYCDRIANQQREKFRRFSGTARVVIEIRVSEDRWEDLERRVHLYVDSITKILENNRGDWGQGMGFGGGYEVQIGAMKSGGKNYIQGAKVVLEVDVSQN
jgi:hypothetical protein